MQENISASLPDTIPYKKQGPAIFGYMWKEGCLVINESEAQIRGLMYEFFLKTKRKKTTAIMLNNLGYRTRTGRPFSHTTVNRLLQDTTAKGVYAIEIKATNKGYTEGTNITGNRTYIQCPSIVSEELWNSCQSLLRKSTERKHRGPQTAYLLSGYLYCRCGRSMYVYHRNKYPAFRCRACKTKIMVDDIEAIYREQLYPFLLVAGDVSNQAESHTVIKDSMSVYIEWAQLSFSAKRSIIEAITQKIILFTNTIDIRFVNEIATHPFINVGKSEQLTSFSIVNKYQMTEKKAK